MKGRKSQTGWIQGCFHIYDQNGQRVACGNNSWPFLLLAGMGIWMAMGVATVASFLFLGPDRDHSILMRKLKAEQGQAAALHKQCGQLRQSLALYEDHIQDRWALQNASRWQRLPVAAIATQRLSDEEKVRVVKSEPPLLAVKTKGEAASQTIGIEDFRLRNRPGDGLLQIQFRLVNKSRSTGRIKGKLRVQVHPADSLDAKPLPSAALHDAYLREDFFSIANFKNVSMDSKIDLETEQIDHASVTVIDATGKVLLRETFPVMLIADLA